MFIYIYVYIYMYCSGFLKWGIHKTIFFMGDTQMVILDLDDPGYPHDFENLHLGI